MDRNADGHLSLPEYLMIYGKWARQALPEEIIGGDKNFWAVLNYRRES